MATYTTLLRDVVDVHGDNILGNYPIFDEGYRLPLNEKILGHYRFQEIGLETPDLFIHQARQRMIEIMPYYNQLYLTEKLKFDPLIGVTLATLSESNERARSDNESDSASTADSDNKSRAVSSETPQTMLSGNGDYAASSADSTGTTSTTSSMADKSAASSESGSLGQSLMEGRQQSASVLLMEFRQTFLNIDVAVINELQDLFMGVWNNGDVMPSHTHASYFNVYNYWRY